VKFVESAEVLLSLSNNQILSYNPLKMKLSVSGGDENLPGLPQAVGRSAKSWAFADRLLLSTPNRCPPQND